MRKPAALLRVQIICELQNGQMLAVRHPIDPVDRQQPEALTPDHVDLNFWYVHCSLTKLYVSNCHTQ